MRVPEQTGLYSQSLLKNKKKRRREEEIGERWGEEKMREPGMGGERRDVGKQKKGGMFYDYDTWFNFRLYIFNLS